MAWVRIDDHFDEHPKIAALEACAIQAFVFGLCYCNRNLTDGFVPKAIGVRYPRKAVKALEGAGLWEPVTGGWQVHDYRDFQPSRDDVQRERQRSAERQARHRGSNAVTDSVTESVTNAVTHSPVTPAPYPTPYPYPIKDVAAAAAPPAAKDFRRLDALLGRPPRRLRQQDESIPDEVLERLSMHPIEINGSGNAER